MKQSVSHWDFEDAFRAHDRYGQFGYDGLKALYEYLEDLGDDIGEEIELDVIAICCDYTLYDNIQEFNKNYNTEYESHEDIDETSVIRIDDESFIIQNY